MTLAEIILSIEIGLVYAIVAMGIYLTFRVIDFADLSCDGSFVSGAAACAIAIKTGSNPFVALLLGLLAGCIAGLVTGFLHVYCRISSLLAGILTAFMLYSINLRIMQGSPNLALLSEKTIFSSLPTLFVLSLTAMLVYSAIGYTLSTDWGLALRSVGQNQTLARAGGVSVGLYTIIVLAASNGLVGLGGALFCQHQQFADISQGIGTVIIGLAGVMVGERILPWRSTWVALAACIVGSVLYRLLVAAALHGDLLGLHASDLNLVTGVLMVLIMFKRKRI